MGFSDPAAFDFPVVRALATAAEHDEEVHAVDADGGVVADAEVDVLGDAEAERAVVCEVVLAQLVLADPQALLEDFAGPGAAHGDVAGDFFVAPDAKGADGQAGAGEDGRLAAQLLEHAARTDEAVAGLAHAAVEAQLPNNNFPHRIRLLSGH